MHKYLSYNCSDLNKSHVGQIVKLSGWVHFRRNHGSLIVIDLRDHFGITQLVIDRDDDYERVEDDLSEGFGEALESEEFVKEEQKRAHKHEAKLHIIDQISSIKLESEITIVGTVVARTKETINPNIPTGEIEVRKLKELIVKSATE